MPEGPEIWRSADALNEVLAGKPIKDINFAFNELKQYESELAASTISTVKPRGKALIVQFENGMDIYTHNQLYGKWMIHDRGEEPDTNRQLRIEILNSDKAARLYSASDIEILEHNELEKHSYIKKLGPDVVDPDVTLDEVLAHVKDDQFKNRQLATLLLDQGFLSGLGNYLRSEVLFKAGLLPGRKPAKCSEEELEKIANAAITLARRSYQTKGITNDPQRAEQLKEQGVERSSYRHYVFNREGEGCFECGTIIQKIDKGGRRLYFCEKCQA